MGSIINKLHLDKIGAAGTILSSLIIAPACCLPLIAAAGAALGLSALAPMEGIFLYLFKAFLVLTIIGAIFSFRARRKFPPLIITIISAAAIFYGLQINLSQSLIAAGFVGLIMATIWNSMAGKKCCGCNRPVEPSKSVQLESTITCPHCGFQQTEIMPADSCVYFYKCKNCQTLLKPKPGDCCVFCSYGTVKCPPKQHVG